MKPITAIDALGAKLGLAAGQIWNVMLMQAKIEGIADIILAIVAAVVFVGCSWVVRYAYRELLDDDGPVIVIAGVGLIAMCVMFSYLFAAISALANPGYWALKEILK